MLRERVSCLFVEGIQIVRRGGNYSVYFWAFWYYMTKFRGKIDVIVDSENGTPFFTPLYAREPVIGLVHHIHLKEVYRRQRAEDRKSLNSDICLLSIMEV